MATIVQQLLHQSTPERARNSRCERCAKVMHLHGCNHGNHAITEALSSRIHVEISFLIKGETYKNKVTYTFFGSLFIQM